MLVIGWSEIPGINTLHTHTEIRQRVIITSHPDISTSRSFARGSVLGAVKSKPELFLSALRARHDVVTKT